MAERDLAHVGDGLAASCTSVRQCAKAAEAVLEARVVVGLVLKGHPRSTAVDEALYALERKFWQRCSELENRLEARRGSRG